MNELDVRDERLIRLLRRAQPMTLPAEVRERALRAARAEWSKEESVGTPGRRRPRPSRPGDRDWNSWWDTRGRERTSSRRRGKRIGGSCARC